MDYQKKYLKYKSKYLNLKAQSGGTLFDFFRDSETQTNRENSLLKSGVYADNCPNGYYNFVDFNTDHLYDQCIKDASLCKDFTLENINKSTIEESHKEKLRSLKARLTEDNKIKHICQSNELNINCFDSDLTWKNLENDQEKKLIFDYKKYQNGSSLHDNNLFKDKNMICLEGNIIYSDLSTNICSGGITSCLFLVLFMDNGNKINIHLNQALSNYDMTIHNYTRKTNERFSYKLSHNNVFSFLKTNYAEELKKVNKIFIGGITSDYKFSQTPTYDLISKTDFSKMVNLGDLVNKKKKNGDKRPEYLITSEILGSIFEPYTITHMNNLQIKTILKSKLNIDHDFKVIKDTHDFVYYMICGDNIYKYIDPLYL